MFTQTIETRSENHTAHDPSCLPPVTDAILFSVMPTVFQEKVYDLCRRVPAGRVTTYGEIARALGTRAFQAVGQALRRNPYAPAVPCHRVVSANGALHGFNGKTSGCELCRKEKLLKAEGIAITAGNITDLDAVLFRF